MLQPAAGITKRDLRKERYETTHIQTECIYLPHFWEIRNDAYTNWVYLLALFFIVDYLKFHCQGIVIRKGHFTLEMKFQRNISVQTTTNEVEYFTMCTAQSTLDIPVQINQNKLNIKLSLPDVLNTFPGIVRCMNMSTGEHSLPQSLRCICKKEKGCDNQNNTCICIIA